MTQFHEGPKTKETNMQKLFAFFITQHVVLLTTAALACDTTGRGCFPPPVPAPGPIVGAGLGYLVLAGGAYAIRRWRKRGQR